ncbi:MAG: flagellar biosynthesis protein FliQ [Candidatus Eremiobacteraeota bacterium]|nr:flagellar biosynthesis protein FliQ [Candidatus Eremiobacteraeota bacterium]MBV8354354.1 flagellar biosynthesis protein FliQ [Candidatus Eremiobacteraeota bacterium]
MTFADALSLGRDAIVVTMLVCAPALILGLITGLIVSLLQAVTQVQEPTLAFIPKILVVGVAVLFFGPFMLALMTDFAHRVIAGIPNFVK